MKELHHKIQAAIQRAQTAKVAAMTLACPATVAGDELATLLAELSRDFAGLSVELRQAARQVADAEAASRPNWVPPKMTKARALRELEKRGAYRGTA